MFLFRKNAILVTLKQIQKKEEEHTWKKSSNTGVDLASSTPTFWNKVKTFLSKTLNGMTFGIFGTIVVGAIIQTLGIITGIDVLS